MIAGISAGLSALNAIQVRNQSTANNVANANSDGYKKTRVSLVAGEVQGEVSVNVQKVGTAGPLVSEPTAAGETLVEQSNVELTEELPAMLIDRRAFQANLKTIQAQDEMLGSLLDIKG